ncbi:hypothetical protein ACGFZQ_25075 [Streptomyces sp. NPDC048254]|uniref:hypothetical protein n=1 Tax=Streptomyces sp. NPDC048254 TaxID=3365525 RepID=UPI003721C259
MTEASKKQKIATLENHASSPDDGSSTVEPLENHAGSVTENEIVKPLENHAGVVEEGILKTLENHAGSETA